MQCVDHANSQYCCYHQELEDQQGETKLTAFMKLYIQCTEGKQKERDDECILRSGEKPICAMHVVKGMIRHCRKRGLEKMIIDI